MHDENTLKIMNSGVLHLLLSNKLHFSKQSQEILYLYSVKIIYKYI